MSDPRDVAPAEDSRRRRLPAAVVLVLGLLLGTVGAALGTAGPAAGIVNGSPDDAAHPMVGELLFYLPDTTDPRFDVPGAWASCSGTLLDADTVVTAGHCTYGVGQAGASTLAGGGSGSGGTDVWFTTEEKPDLGVLPPTAGFLPHDVAGRYRAWSAVLDSSPQWVHATAVPHPEYHGLPTELPVADDEATFHDVGVLQLDRPVRLSAYGRLPGLGLLDTVATTHDTAPFTVVGYGQQQPGPASGIGANTRRTTQMVLADIAGVPGIRRGEVATFTGRDTARPGGTCYGDSGGPVLAGRTRVVTAVVSFVLGSDCTGATGGYRLDQPDDLDFLAPYVSGERAA